MSYYTVYLFPKKYNLKDHYIPQGLGYGDALDHGKAHLSHPADSLPHWDVKSTPGGKKSVIKSKIGGDVIGEVTVLRLVTQAELNKLKGLEEVTEVRSESRPTFTAQARRVREVPIKQFKYGHWALDD